MLLSSDGPKKKRFKALRSMLTTDAYAFLDIDNPLCAWATYRSVLVCAADRPGCVSVWTAGMTREGDPARIVRERTIEDVRRTQFHHRISRLRGMFCFPDAASAQRACSWDHGQRTQFQPQYLAELSLVWAGPNLDRLDANWITYAPVNEYGYLTETGWIRSYWEGAPIRTRIRYGRP